MSDYPTYPSPQRDRLLRLLTRREFFSRLGAGGSALALAAMLSEEAAAAPPQAARYDLLPKQPHFPGKAKRVIYLFQNGGPSQVDLFDPKPELKKREGEKPGEGYVNDVDAAKTGLWLGSPFEFAPHGKSGLVLSELLPGLARHADEIAVIRSMVSEHENHEQACGHMHTGSPVAGRPTMGAWVTYGLGTENQNLPAFVALLNPAGVPVDGARNWSSGWMPPLFQGLAVRATEKHPILDLEPRVPAEAGAARLRFLQRLNQEHLRSRQDNLELEARIANFELAARMQLEATDALDLSQESEATRTLYGLDKKETEVYGRECLLARRLVERGVRFVQVMMAGQPWDTHSDNNNGLRSLCASTDGPVAGLLTDLRQRGLMEDTLVIWTGEFGRTPFAEGKDGRDHHKRGFSMWLAGAGIQGGSTMGATDEFAYNAVDDIVHAADLHGTILHLLGLDHTQVTFRHDSRDERLTDVHDARLLTPILA
jgi:hypothetical protein